MPSLQYPLNISPKINKSLAKTLKMLSREAICCESEIQQGAIAPQRVLLNMPHDEAITIFS